VDTLVRFAVQLDRYRFFYLLAIVVWLSSGLGAILGWWSFHWAAFVSAAAALPHTVLQRKLHEDEED
jgi:hypothetical protein